MELRPEIVNQVMQFSTKEVEFLGSIIEQGEYGGISISKSVIDSTPTARELFGSQFGGTNETNVFKFIAPNVAWGSSSSDGRYVGNGKLLSVYTVENAIPADVLGPNGEITTQTTSWAIDKVKNGEMSAKEAVIIIRQRTDTLSSETRYFTPNLIDTTNPPSIDDLDQESAKNTERKPFDTPYNVNAVNFEDPLIYAEQGARAIRNSLGSSIGVNIVMRYKAERAIDLFYEWGKEVEENLITGVYKEENVNGQRIIYRIIENEYKRPLPPGIERPKTKFSDRKKISHPETIKEVVLPPVSNDLQEGYSSEPSIQATTLYMGYCQSGKDASGNSTPTDSSKQLESVIAGEPTSEIIDYGKDRQSDIDVSPNKGILYGNKTQVYGTLIGAGLTLIGASKYAPASGESRLILEKLADDPTEGLLTVFKLGKDAESGDGFRFVRDYAAYWLGHAITHPHGPITQGIANLYERTILSIGGRLILAYLPPGWVLAIINVTYDVVVSPFISYMENEAKRYELYDEAITINEREREDGTKEAWCLDPGFALYGVKVERPVLGPGITTRIVEAGGIDDGLGESIQSEPPNVISTSPIIGVKKDPVTGKAAVDSNQNIVPIYDEDGVKPGLDTTQPKIIAGEEISDYRLSEPRIQQKIKSSYIKDQVAKQESIILISRAEYFPVDMGFYDVNPIRREEGPPEDDSIDQITPPEWDITYEDSIWIDNWYNSLSSDVLSNPVLPGNRTKLSSYPYISSQININANGEPQTPSFYGNETFTIPSL